MILIHKKVHTRRVSVGLAYGMRPSEDGDGPRAYETVSTASPVFATAREPVSRSTTRKRGEHFAVSYWVTYGPEDDLVSDPIALTRTSAKPYEGGRKEGSET